MSSSRIHNYTSGAIYLGVSPLGHRVDIIKWSPGPVLQFLHFSKNACVAVKYISAWHCKHFFQWKDGNQQRLICEPCILGCMVLIDWKRHAEGLREECFLAVMRHLWASSWTPIMASICSLFHYLSCNIHLNMLVCFPLMKCLEFGGKIPLFHWTHQRCLHFFRALAIFYWGFQSTMSLRTNTYLPCWATGSDFPRQACRNKKDGKHCVQKQEGRQAEATVVSDSDSDSEDSDSEWLNQLKTRARNPPDH